MLESHFNKVAGFQFYCNIRIVIICFPVDDIINFEVYLRSSCQKVFYKICRTKNAFFRMPF